MNGWLRQFLDLSHDLRHATTLCGHNPLYWQMRRHLTAPRRVDQTRYDVLLFAPIGCQGLTVQAAQVVEALQASGRTFRLTSYAPPSVADPIARHWVAETNPGRPDTILFMETFSRLLPPNRNQRALFYANTDQLGAYERERARAWRARVIAPSAASAALCARAFHPLPVEELGWPSPLPITHKRDPLGKTIRVLYVGNDADRASRKHPFEVIEAIERLPDARFRFLLKFRSPLPRSLARRLAALPQVEVVAERPLPRSEMLALCDRSDVKLIPNGSEGCGLSILEAMARGVVPIVLDGAPMDDLVSSEIGYRIPCRRRGRKGIGWHYATTAREIAHVLGSIDEKGLQSRRDALTSLAPSLLATQEQFRARIEALLH